jgi:hypothetical protein
VGLGDDRIAPPAREERAVRVRVRLAVVAGDRVDHRLRDLGAAGAVEEDDRPAVLLEREGREAGAERVDVEGGHRGPRGREWCRDRSGVAPGGRKWPIDVAPDLSRDQTRPIACAGPPTSIQRGFSPPWQTSADSAIQREAVTWSPDENGVLRCRGGSCSGNDRPRRMACHDCRSPTSRGHVLGARLAHRDVEAFLTAHAAPDRAAARRGAAPSDHQPLAEYDHPPPGPAEAPGRRMRMHRLADGCCSAGWRDAADRPPRPRRSVERSYVTDAAAPRPS